MRDSEEKIKMKFNKNLLIGLLRRSWSFLFLIILTAFFSVVGKGFFSFENLQNILLLSSVTMLLAMGQTFVIISGGFDLSVAYISGLATVVAAQLMKMMNIAGINPVIIIITGFIAGVSICIVPGFINGFIIARFKISPLIVTLGIYGICRGAALIISSGYPIGKQPQLLGRIGNGYLLYFLPGEGFSFWNVPNDLPQERMREIVQIIPYPVIILLICLVILHFVLSRTRFGLYTYIIGGNEESARRTGIDVDKHKIRIYILSAVIAGIAGMIYCMRYTSGSATSGEPKLLDSIAAVVIGGTSLSGGSGTIIPGTLIGTLIIAVLQTGLVSMAVSPYYQFLAVGSVIIVAVIVDQLFPSVYSIQ